MSAPRMLAWNQVFFGAILFVYAVWSLYASRHGTNPLAAELQQDPELANSAVASEMMGNVQSMTQLIFDLLYGTLMLVAIFGQGGTALYYASRTRILREYVEQTPPWVLEMQRAGVA